MKTGMLTTFKMNGATKEEIVKVCEEILRNKK